MMKKSDLVDMAADFKAYLEARALAGAVRGYKTPASPDFRGKWQVVWVGGLAAYSPGREGPE